MRLKTRSIVDLPHPEGPIMAVILFGSMLEFMFFKA
jgi:hypothetical protein